MMIEFICKRSGNKVSFSKIDDINLMRKHEGYTEVKNEIETESITNTNVKQEDGKSIIDNPSESKNGKENERKEDGKVLKKRGRPSKK